MYSVGIDIGSTYAKVIALDESGEIAYRRVALTGWNSVSSAEDILKELRQEGIEREQMYCVATGYGRGSVEYADKSVTEITCHAKGAARLFGSGSYIVIDVGGQDTKIIALEDGHVKDFIMNDKCAAGTGRFLEVMAGALGLTTDMMCKLSEKGSGVTINSMCAVFAESEVIGLMGKGTAKEDIAYGIVDSIASKVKTQCSRMSGRSAAYYLTGGLSDNDVFIHRLSEKIGSPVRSDRDGRFAGALGAAVIAHQSVQQGGKA